MLGYSLDFLFLFFFSPIRANFNCFGGIWHTSSSVELLFFLLLTGMTMIHKIQERQVSVQMSLGISFLYKFFLYWNILGYGVRRFSPFFHYFTLSFFLIVSSSYIYRPWSSLSPPFFFIKSRGFGSYIATRGMNLIGCVVGRCVTLYCTLTIYT
ncbi:uncharacterized protein GGS25DRAFT_140825 [Hypoxylon fragiforme]|uniref:uncharacterized protein n=1 Tax=Hypoxylon fragiforme TaxID=63214 RepID=UPI0020C6BA93|nr:uncharacterized protein GGS25DRAFT_140825 [Hypoxylon fragiforme]KAI2612891.1 hypothetical protein GGS25DRAFT_140825 [Hypoxylon fragiforme]